MKNNHFEHPSSLCKVSYATIRKAMARENLTVYHMSLTDEDSIRAVVDCVNAGIDAHLEACFVPERGDKYSTGERKIGKVVVCRTLECEVSAESLPVLLRRLSEIEFEHSNEAGSLVSDILQTLGIDEYGKLVGLKAAGMD